MFVRSEPGIWRPNCNESPRIWILRALAGIWKLSEPPLMWTFLFKSIDPFLNKPSTVTYKPMQKLLLEIIRVIKEFVWNLGASNHNSLSWKKPRLAQSKRWRLYQRPSFQYWFAFVNSKTALIGLECQPIFQNPKVFIGFSSCWTER